MAHQQINEDFYLLNDSKKAQIMQELRREIDQQKMKFSTNNNNLQNSNNSNYNDNYYNPALYNTESIIQQQNSYDYTPYNNNENNFNEQNNFINHSNNEIESENEEEKHMEILNRAKMSLQQIKNDLNNLSQENNMENDNINSNVNNNINYLYYSNNNDFNNNENNSSNNPNYNNLQQPSEQEEQQENLNDYSNNINQYQQSNKESSSYHFLNNYSQFQEPNTIYSPINYMNDNENNLVENERNSEEEIDNKIMDYIPANYNNINNSKYNFANPLNYDKSSIRENLDKNPDFYNNYVNEVENKNNIKIKPKKNKRTNDNIPHSKSSQKLSKYSKKMEEMKKELEQKFIENHPFKPNINNKNLNNTKNQETSEERFNRLSRPRIFDINEKKRLKEIEETKKLENNNTQNNSIHKINPQEVSNRLYNNYQQLQNKKNHIKKYYNETQDQEYSFSPEININSKLIMDKYPQKPIYERNEDFVKNKTANIIEMRQKIEQEQKERSKPIISENSKKIMSHIPQNKNVYSRLYHENINNDKKKIVNPEIKECTFTPKLNPTSKKLCYNFENEENSSSENEYDDEYYDEIGENMKNFLKRQKIYEKNKKEKNKINTKNENIFKPKINSNSDLITKCNPNRIGETYEDKYNRLYEDAQRIKQKKEQLDTQFNQYDFKPKINEFSKFIGRDTTIEELNQYHLQNNNTNIEKNEEYSFKPQMYNNSKYKNIQSNYKNDIGILDRINDEIKNKKEKLIELKKAKENQAVEECNFVPEINNNMPNFENNKPMYMKGMARYLNQMEKARQAKRDKEQREKEVFITGENWSQNKGVTVPKPFKLSYQYKQKNKNMEIGKQQIKDNNIPKYNENKNRDLIKKLLGNNE